MIFVFLHKQLHIMNRYVAILLLLMVFVAGCRQKDVEIATNENSLLWRVSGNGLEEPSYLYGTVHILCSEDAVLSENFKKIIRKADEVYFEIDMDDLKEMMSLAGRMKMKGDTTLELLLNESDLEKVKRYVEDNTPMFPFSEIKTFLPIISSTILVEQIIECDEKTGIEEAIMEVAKKHRKGIHGLETPDYQFRLLDSIPYAQQATELVSFVDSASEEGVAEQIMGRVYKAYLEQDLEMVRRMTMEMDSSIIKNADMLLYNRNRNWVIRLKKIMPEGSMVIAVGAAHLPGEKGVINMLKKEGYEVTPLQNELPLKGKKD